MCSIARIDRFLERWPEAEFGPGHIVLSDANLRDSDLDHSLGIIRAMQYPDEPSEYRRQADEYLSDEWLECPPEEIEATRVFLEMLRALPEEERVGPEDCLCGDECGDEE